MSENSPHKLLYTDFDIRNITIYPTFFSNGTSTDHTKNARKKNLLHLITCGFRKYYFEGREMDMPMDSLILIPDNTHYLSVAYCSPENKCGGIGICFDVFLPNGDIFQLKPGIYSNWNTSPQHYRKYVYHLQKAFQSPSHSIMEIKIYLYRLLHDLITNIIETDSSYSMIEPAIHYLAKHYTQNCPVKTYADQCQLSESYFRKKFTECMGMSPIEYRNKLRFQTARLLYQDNKTLQEIAELTGFCDEKHFMKSYKRANGTSIKKDLNGV